MNMYTYIYSYTYIHNIALYTQICQRKKNLMGTQKSPPTHTLSHTHAHTLTRTLVWCITTTWAWDRPGEEQPPEYTFPPVSACVRNGRTSSQDIIPVTPTHKNSLSYTCMYVHTHTHTHTHAHVHTHVHLGIHVCLFCRCRQCERKRVCGTCVWVFTILWMHILLYLSVYVSVCLSLSLSLSLHAHPWSKRARGVRDNAVPASN
jgi:hypothetical protein